MRNSEFIKIYKLLPRAEKERSKKRDQIIKECGVTRSIFYNWIAGITPVDENSQKIISQILGIKQKNLFPIN